MLDQTQGETHLPVQKAAFEHPVDVSPLSGFKCTDCHEGAGAFKHPVDLGDISESKCTDCHNDDYYHEMDYLRLESESELEMGKLWKGSSKI